MSARRIDVFFYGLFMDADLLRSKGVHPENVRQACAPGFALRIGQRASLIRDAHSRAYGVVMSLTHAEIDQLYSETSVQAYRPEAVLIELSDGSQSPVLSFNLVEPPKPEERNPEYAAKLRSLAQLLGLPQEYINAIQ
jgi:hypothetical protein